MGEPSATNWLWSFSLDCGFKVSAEQKERLLWPISEDPRVVSRGPSGSLQDPLLTVSLCVSVAMRLGWGRLGWQDAGGQAVRAIGCLHSLSVPLLHLSVTVLSEPGRMSGELELCGRVHGLSPYLGGFSLSWRHQATHGRAPGSPVGVGSGSPGSHQVPHRGPSPEVWIVARAPSTSSHSLGVFCLLQSSFFLFSR